jgi:YgiT-type zinc finger domain-containing protein
MKLKESECLPEGLCSCCFEGQLRDETSDYVCDYLGSTITVKDLPCTKCDKCDERFYSPAAARRIEDAVEKLREEMGLEPLLREPRNLHPEPCDMDEDGVGCKPQDRDR